MAGIVAERVYVLAVEKLTARDYLLLLKAPQLAAQAVPGQFLHLRVRDSLFPFLRRPFSVAGVSPEKGMVQIIFRVVGEGTAFLSQVKEGDGLHCLGPLGKGFRPLPNVISAALLAGGIGVAPLIFLAHILTKERKKTVLFYGVASTAALLPLKKFLPRETEIRLATEDGSSGYRGSVTALFARALQDGLKPEELFACGPKPMLQVLAEKNRKWNFPLQLSLEERMACGLGACQGCALKTRQGGNTFYRMVCRDGPVFDAQEVEW